MSFLTGERLIRGNNVWFPAEGKEARCDGVKPLVEPPVVRVAQNAGAPE